MTGEITRRVDCGTCTLCCWNEPIYLFPDMGDQVAAYQTRLVINPMTGRQVLALDQRPNGACVYLGDGRCTIHEHRPALCKGFSCAEFYRSFTEEERKVERNKSPQHARLLKRGREIAKAEDAKA